MFFPRYFCPGDCHFGYLVFKKCALDSHQADLRVKAAGTEGKSQRNQKPKILAEVSAHSVLLFCFFTFVRWGLAM